MNKYIKYICNQRGISLPLSLMVLIVMTFLGTALYYYSSIETKKVSMDENKMQAHYYARSGIEITYKFIEENIDDIEDENVFKNFYIYGDLDNNFNLVYGEYDDLQNSNNIVVTVSWNAGSETIEGTIESRGLYQNAVDVVTLTVEYTPQIDEDSLLEPSDDAVDAGTEGWYGNDGKMVSNGGSSDVSVKFNINKDDNYEDDDIIHQLSNTGNSIFTAPEMYFLDEPTSVEVRNNGKLILNSNFLVFKGDINCKDANKDQLFLYTNDSKLTGEDLDNEGFIVSFMDNNNSTNFGLIYFEDGYGVKIGEETIDLDGFYYFPDGIHLEKLGDDDQLERLIQVDIDDINLEKLGLSGSTDGGLKQGNYN